MTALLLCSSALRGQSTSPSSAAARDATKPETTFVSAAIACKSCRIDLKKVATLRPSANDPAFVSPFRFETDSKGNFYVVDPFGTVGVRVFDRSGKPVYSIDRKGGGPGEFTHIYTIAIGPGDSLHVHGNNYSVFGPGGKHQRSVAPPGRMRPERSIFLSQGRQLVLGNSGVGKTGGVPFHIIDARGNVTSNFGPEVSAAAVVNPWASRVVLAPSTGNSFWTAASSAYAIEKWSLDGQLLRTIARRVDWFQPWVNWDGRSDTHPPPPRFMSVHEDGSRVLWSLLLVADSRWRADPTASTGERRMSTMGELETRMDTMIEAVDLRDGSLLASLRLDGVFVAMFGNRLVAQTREESSGEVVVDIWQFTLERAAPR